MLEQGNTPDKKAGESQPIQDNANTAPLPKPMQAFVPERECDGLIVGAGGLVFPVDVDLETVPRIDPNNGTAAVDRVIFVNGILTDLSRQVGDMQWLANSGASVIGIHNSTYGRRADIDEYFRDKMGKEQSPACVTLIPIIRRAVLDETPLHLVGHSQGALIVARSLEHVLNELQKAEPGKNHEARFSHLRVETYGGGSASYIDGPQYVHVNNTLDPVSQFLGLGIFSGIYHPEKRFGRGAVIRNLTIVNTDWKRSFDGPGTKNPSVVDMTVHGPRLYFPERLSFDEARKLGSKS